MVNTTFRQFLSGQEGDQQAQAIQAVPDIEASGHAIQQNTFHSHYIVSEDQCREGILSGIWSALTGVVKWAVNSVAKTISHVLAPFGDSSEHMGAKMEYASMLLLTFGLSGTLLAAGVPMAVAAAAMPFTSTMWGLMWFGKNFLEPVLKMTDR